jgi:cytosine deaminase
MDLIIKNAKLAETRKLKEIGVKDGIITRIEDQLPVDGKMTIDAGGHLVTSPFIDPHLHLDAALTAGNPRYNRSGSHPEGIQVWGEYKQQFPGFEDFNARARQAVEWEVAQGTIYIRTHIDICDPNLAALNQMLALREELRDIAEIQIVAFPQDGILSQPKNRELMEEALKLGADLVGGIPHCEFTREDGVESIAIIYDLAEKYDRDIDIHCDETDDQHSRFLEVAAAQAIRRGYQGRVSAGHTTAMHSYNNAYAFKLQGLLQLAGIHIIANPFDNIVLMGRFDTYPKRRGVTRVKELLQAGVNVCLGHDSIMDPWYPLGKGDMLEAALLAVHICHMSGADEIRRIFDTITVNAARAFGISEIYGIEEGRKADFVILDCDTIMDAVRLSPARRYVIKAGRVVARTQPARSQVDYPKQPVSVDFKKPDDSA